MRNSHEAVINTVGIPHHAGNYSNGVDRQGNRVFISASSSTGDVKQSYAAVTGTNKAVKDRKNVIVVSSRCPIRGNGDGVRPGTAGTAG